MAAITVFWKPRWFCPMWLFRRIEHNTFWMYVYKTWESSYPVTTPEERRSRDYQVLITHFTVKEPNHER